MSLVGSSPAELQAAAGELDRAADWVRSSSSELASSLGSLSWAGAGALQFTDIWTSRYRPALGSTEGFLRDQADRLREQAQQQLAASGDGGGAAGASASRHGGWGGLLRSLGRRAPGVPRWATEGYSGIDGALGFLGPAALLVAPASTRGRYSNAWRRVIAVGGDFVRYKSSPILQGLAGNRALRGLRSVSELGPVKAVSRGLGWIGTAASVGRVVNAVRHGNAFDVFTAGVDAVADGLKGSKNPVLYLAGAGVSAWQEFGTQLSTSMTNGTWTTMPPNPFENDAWRTVYLGAAPNIARDSVGVITRVVT